MSRFLIEETPLAGLKLIKRQVIKDERGFLSRLFCREELAAIFNVEKHIVQINHTKTLEMGSIRGLHYQLPPYSEIKLVTCLVGEILDVVVDIRKNSATFLKWHAEVLSAENANSFFIPEGFAHGFYVMSESADFSYKCTDYYSPAFERSLLWNDATVGIEWPIPLGSEPTLSAKDAVASSFLTAEVFGA
jgi:dTDP-4-dehydrorhamnose 3,5-epimerase